MTLLIPGPTYLLLPIAMRPLNKSHRVLRKGAFTDEAVFFWTKKKKVATATPDEFSTSPAHKIYVKGLS